MNDKRDLTGSGRGIGRRVKQFGVGKINSTGRQYGNSKSNYSEEVFSEGTGGDGDQNHFKESYYEYLHLKKRKSRESK